MSERPSQLPAPDLSQGVALNSLVDGEMLLGHVGGEPAVLVRRGADLFAVGATCTHYGGPLSEGLVVGDTVRCPWHHACFSLRTGAALRPPALNSLTRWRVEQRDGMAFVREPQPAADVPPAPVARDLPSSVVIIGGGGAGNAAAETLRREGYAGAITLQTVWKLNRNGFRLGVSHDRIVHGAPRWRRPLSDYASARSAR
jgi:apoptosis-inducing factor 3